MKITSLIVWACVASAFIACGGQVASTSSGNGSGSGANNKGANGANGGSGDVDPGAPVPSGADPSVWVAPSSPAPAGFFVDGVACTSVQVGEQDAQGAPCGRTWTLDITATCGALGAVSLDLSGGDAVYPQVCHSVDEIECDDPSSGGMSAGLTLQSDGSTSWSASGAGAGCSVTNGPTADNGSIPVSVQGTVANGAGATHAFSYNAGPDSDAGP